MNGLLFQLPVGLHLRSQLQDMFRHAYSEQGDTFVEYLAETWRRFQDGVPVAEPIDRLRTAAERAFCSLDLLDGASSLDRTDNTAQVAESSSIVSSYLHMMNNRLGVTLAEEAYVAYACARALRILEAPAAF
jgi:hypothetical protein